LITINKDTQVNFKTDSRLLEKAKEIFAMNQLDLTAGFNLFLQNIAVKNELPHSDRRRVGKRRVVFTASEGNSGKPAGD
jgi:antitoxin component of RelBE/YafQ-DinJ toxin-antitoxin module